MIPRRLRIPNAGAIARACALAWLVAGCSSGGIDPPPDDEKVADTPVAEPDSMAAWAQRARDGWASGDSMRADAAGALARKAFQAAWAQVSDDLDAVHHTTTSERLPTVETAAAPGPGEVSANLARIGLAADVVVASGTPTVWQVTVADPVGSSQASTEFWAWPDPRTAGGPPIVQALPPRAPARTRYGPDAVGELTTWTAGEGAGLASAWGRPRSRGGLEVAIAVRKKGDAATWAVTSNRVLPLAADTVAFEVSAGGGPPTLIVIGAGERDPMFDDCPTCPHLDRVQRYVFRGETWSLSEEHVTPTPYSVFVAFLHALRQGTPESALPYAAGPTVIEQATGIGLDRARTPLRAALGTTARDLTQRYRTNGSEAVEVTLEPAGDHWVVADVRASQLVIE
ncbi:MAG: hypothetical protein ABI960_11730 [Candidatus Eisenbacteria bacterium]